MSLTSKFLIGAGALVAVAAGAWFVADHFLDQRLKERVDEEIAELPPGIDVTYGDIDGSFLGNGVLRDVSIRNDGEQLLTLAALHIDEIDLENNPPLFARMRLDGFDVTLPETSEPAAFRNLTGDLSYAYRFNREAKDFRIEEFHLKLHELAELRGGLVISNILPPNPDHPEASVMALLGAQIAGFKLQLTDHDLTTRFLGMSAAAQGISDAEMRAQAAELLDQRLSQAKSQLERDAFTGLKAFLIDPEVSSLSLQAIPDKPFPLARFMFLQLHPDPASQLSQFEDLNLRIEAN